MARRALGRQFGWLWGAYAVSAYGSGIGFGAFPLIAVRVLHSGPAEVSALSAAGLAVSALVAVPLAPWVEFRRKRPVMMAMDLIRFAAMMSIPASFALGLLSYGQLLVVAIIVGAAKIAFNAASGANLKTLVKPDDLLVATGRFESTTWSAIMVGPPLGGLAIGLLGPVTTMLADAVSYLLSAAGISMIRKTEPRPEHGDKTRLRLTDLADGWRHILSHPVLRLLFINSMLVTGLLLATEPLLVVLMVGRLGFAPWQFGLAFAAPCAGALIGSRLARRVVARFGQHQVMLVGGTLRVCCPVGLAFMPRGVAGIIVVIVLQLGVVTSISVFNPVLAAYRLENTARDRISRTLSAWSVSSNATIAVLTALWGVLASFTGPRIAIGAAGVLLLATPLALPRRDGVTQERPASLAPGTAAAPR